MKKLTDLNPKWSGRLRPNSGEALEFDCPVCSPTHRLVAYFKNPLDGKEAANFPDVLWTREGDTFETVTVTPSIDYGATCFHGWIERGRVFSVQEGPVLVPRGRGKLELVVLSPLQALKYGKEVMEAAEALLK